MVNLVAAHKPLVQSLMKIAGLRHQLIELEPGTVMSFWVPKHHTKTTKEAAANVTDHKPTDNNTNKYSTANKKKKKKKKQQQQPKPALVLVHGFAADGMVTWEFQFRVLSRDFSLYIPDLLFFNLSTTARADRSPEFQAECLGAALGKLGVERCDVVGFSYGGMVAFKLAEARPELVRSLVIMGSVITMTDSITKASLKRLGMSSWSEFLMPETVEGLKTLLAIGAYRKIWLPNKFYKDYLEVMFNNTKEQKELLERLVISSAEAKIPTFPQRILLLWGEHDNIFQVEFAKEMKKQLGEKATLQVISNAGHLVHIERPCVCNRHVKEFLTSVHKEDVP